VNSDKRRTKLAAAPPPACKSSCSTTLTDWMPGLNILRE
jgi:hypothetical protein